MKVLNSKTPKGWEIKKIRDLLDFERPDNYIVKSDNYTTVAKTPVLTANKSFILGYTDENFGICNDLPVIIFDDFTTDSKYVDFPFKVKSSAIKILRSKNKDINLKFVFELIKLINFQATNHKRYYISEYQDIDVIVPPSDEQKRIAEILTTVDQEIEKIDKIILQTEKLMNGLMQELFTKGIGHRNYKHAEIGIIPAEWVTNKLGDVLETSSGGTPLKNRKDYYEGGNIPWITSGEVRQGRVYCANQFITNLGLKNSSAKIFPVNTVLVAMYGATAGQVGFLSIEASTNQAVCGVLPNIHFNPEFIYYFLSSKTQKMVLQATGAAQPNISQTVIRNMYLPIPNLTEQNRIVEILSTIEKKISVAKIIKEKLGQLKKGLTQDLLGGKVRIQTD